MKKLLKAALFLLVVGLLILASQISCKKATAQTSTSTPTTPTKVLYSIQAVGEAAHDTSYYQYPGTDTQRLIQYLIPTTYVTQLYYCGTDGSNPTPIPIPSNYLIQSERLTPDGSTVIFQATTSPAGASSIYSMGLDGSNLKTIVNSSVSSSGGVGLVDVN